MRISKQRIKDAFSNAEKDLDYCWEVLISLKHIDKAQEKIGTGIILFQDKLAELILTLNKLRTQIIAEEKYTIKNKSNYNKNWFTSRLKLLASYKKGIDSIVNIGKALGDAYAYFFYRHDLQMLEEHLSHQRIVNSAAGIGEIGEIEFLKRLKHIEGDFTIYHGITNILRYGDYSFIDLKNHKVVRLGELKTKQISENELQFSLTLLQHKKIKKENINVNLSRDKSEKVGNRKTRQIDNLIDFLKASKQSTSTEYKLHNKSYFEEIEGLYKTTKANEVQCKKVSAGLAFSMFKFKKSKLYNKLYFSPKNSTVDKISSEIVETAKQLIKSNSKENSLILGQVLYNSDLSDKSTPGTLPFFWYPLSPNLLKKLYFLELNITAIFNPIHLISDIENLDIAVDSKYVKKEERMKGKKHFIQRFDLFISYIINHLLTENFVIDSLKEVLNNEHELKGKQVLIKPQQHIFEK
jgi:hypothetical protein